jgi:hypothetical protein
VGESKNASTFQTNDPDFEALCDWESTTPGAALNFLNQNAVAKTIRRLCDCVDAATKERNVQIDETQLRVPLPLAAVPSEAEAARFLSVLRGLIFLAETIGGKSAGADSVEVPMQPQKSGAKEMFWSFLGCLLYTVLLFIPLILAWIACAYFLTRALGMWAGMACFFVPILLLAIFVFTRSDAAAPTQSFAKHWPDLELSLRRDPEFAALLDHYARRLRQP